ncbi:DNA repair protein RecN [[Ruminococcus] torques]|nr:DNA repair protein RecN [[Ruminococcus] torques]BEI77605.1 DNA repair protein RecN [[Ruminococcus] torques]
MNGMLQNLHVKNIALIDETEVDFGQGLNILTGETGAGKSILLGSVGLALGGKYSSDLLRNGAENGLVELTFSVDDGQIRQKLEEMDIIPDDGMVTLTRKFTGSRSISRINGETVNTGKLKEAAELLIDIHGQHDNKTLLQRKNHLVLLDLFGRKEIAPIKSEMSKCYKEYRAICKKEEETSLNDEERRRELSLYEFEVHEIEEAALRENEDEELEETYRRMTESRKITDAVAQTYRYTCEDSSANAGDCLTRAIRAFREAAEFDEEGDRLCALLMDVDSLLNDFNRELSEYASKFEFSEEEFKETEERLNLINHLKAKYGSSVSDVLAYCESKRHRIEQLNDYDAYIKQIEEEKEKALKKVERVTKKLHDVRNRYKTVFADEICIHLKELNFLDTRFEIHLKDAGQFSANGKDEAEFYLALNPGEPVKPLENIASGGELSRIMLAIKTVLADAEDTPTLIFDEIDAGISGVTAAKVGEKLKLIGKSRQVICITHLSQIAAVADSHFLIEKSAENESVKTRIRLLNEEDSVKELARILGGDKITSSIMESAREMKEMAKSEI